jgi:hypothetical protein
MFRVTTTRPWTSAVAAMNASASGRGSGTCRAALLRQGGDRHSGTYVETLLHGSALLAKQGATQTRTQSAPSPSAATNVE